MNRCYGCMQQKPNNEKTCPNCGYTNGQEHEEHYYLQEGTILLDRYLIGKVLGHGGFGITYIGFDTRLDVKVAIKEYLPSDIATRSEGIQTVKSFNGDKEEQYKYGLKGFLNEAKTLAKYNEHSCIVSSKDFFEANNTAYLVMEYLDGISLSQYLERKGGKISFDETMQIMMPIMDALREVHKSGIIHRDISPDNIYITKEGHVKLLDFGAARIALGEKSKSLSVVLKPGYAPPEQYITRGKQGTWTDVYAVAATMYRMITGEKAQESTERLLEDKLKSISYYEKRFSSVHNKVIQEALAIRVEERIQTIDEFQEKLNKTSAHKLVMEPKNEMQKKQKRQENTLEQKTVKSKNRVIKIFSIVLVVVVLISMYLLVTKEKDNQVVFETVMENLNEQDIEKTRTLIEHKLDIYGYYNLTVSHNKDNEFVITYPNDAVIDEVMLTADITRYIETKVMTSSKSIDINKMVLEEVFFLGSELLMIETLDEERCMIQIDTKTPLTIESIVEYIPSHFVRVLFGGEQITARITEVNVENNTLILYSEDIERVIDYLQWGMLPLELERQ